MASTTLLLMCAEIALKITDVLLLWKSIFAVQENIVLLEFMNAFLALLDLLAIQVQLEKLSAHLDIIHLVQQVPVPNARQDQSVL